MRIPLAIVLAILSTLAWAQRESWEYGMLVIGVSDEVYVWDAGEIFLATGDYLEFTDQLRAVLGSYSDSQTPGLTPLLNSLGRNGWELVSAYLDDRISADVYLFKRRIGGPKPVRP